MGLLEKIQSTYQRLSLEVRIDDVPYPDVIGVDVTFSFGQPHSHAFITCKAKPPRAEETKPVAIWAGYDSDRVLLFKGVIVGIEWVEWERICRLDCRSVAWRLQLPYGGETRVYSAAQGNSDAAGVIRNLAEAYGINPQTSGHYIEGDGEWTLAQIVDLEFNPGDVAYSLIQRIDELSGYATYSDQAGVLRRTRVRNVPSGNAAFTYTEGVNILQGSTLRRDLSQTANVVKIDGLNYEGIQVFGDAVGENPYIPNPPGYIAYTMSDSLVETDEIAQLFAQQILAKVNRLTVSLELKTFGNPLLRLAMTIGVTAPSLGIASGKFLVHRIIHSITENSWITTISAIGGHLEQGGPPPDAGAPVAVILVEFFRESIIPAGANSPVEIIVCCLDGTTSYDVDSTNPLTYSWSLSSNAGQMNPSTSTAGRFQSYVIPQQNPVTFTFTLTVTDSSNLSTTATLVRTVDINTMKVEDIWSAEERYVVVSTDGGKTWKQKMLPNNAVAKCLCAIAVDYQAFGCTNGMVFATFDKLDTLVSFGTISSGAEISSIYMNESDPSRLWVGTATGEVWYTSVNLTDKTCAPWIFRGTVVAGSRIVEIEEAYNNFNTLGATCGTTLYISFDGGASWQPATQPGSGVSARRMKSGFDRTIWGSRDPQRNFLLQSTRGDTFQFQNQGQPAQIVEACCVQMGVVDPFLMVADDSRPAVFYRGTMGSPPASITLNRLNTALDNAMFHHMIRSGNELGTLYAACQITPTSGGIQKGLNHGESFFWIRRGRVSHMVGYGSPRIGESYIPLREPQLYAVPWEVTSSNLDALWIYNLQTSTWNSKPLPEARRRWSIYVSTYDPRHMILARMPNPDGYFQIYYSGDGGDTWAPVRLFMIVEGGSPQERLPYQFHRNYPGMKNVIFTENQVYIAVEVVNNPSNPQNSYAYPFWGNLPAQTQELALTFHCTSTTGYFVYHWTAQIGNNSTDYFDGNIIFRYLDRGAGSLVDPGSLHFRATSVGTQPQWSHIRYRWNQDPPSSSLPIYSRAYLLNNHFTYASRVFHNQSFGYLSCIHKDAVFPNDYAPPPFACNVGGWGTACCVFGQDLYLVRRFTWGGSMGGSHYAGVMKLPISSIPNIPQPPTGTPANAYAPPDPQDSMVPVIVSSDTHVVTASYSQNAFIVFDGNQWGTINPPPGFVLGSNLSDVFAVS